MAHMQAWTALHQDFDRVQKGIAAARGPRSLLSSDEVYGHLDARYDFVEASDFAATLADVEDLLQRGTLHATHPRYFGLFVPTVYFGSVAADVLASAYNAQLGATWHAPAATAIERFTLDAFKPYLGYPKEGTSAHFTTGGSEANLTAVLSALAWRFPETSSSGLRVLPRQPRMFLSDEGHHSFDKIARHTGLGTDAIVRVPANDRFQMRVDALEHAIRNADGEPFMVVATAGTTAAGAIDPLSEIAEVCEREGLWMHVDAAWGGGALLSPKLRPLLGGIERSDSVTWDAHKWLSIAAGTGMFFTRRPEATAAAFGVETNYVPDREGDAYRSTLQWSRRFIGLRVFLTLAELGFEGYRRVIEHQTEMGDELRLLLRRRNIAVVNETQLPVVLFDHSPTALRDHWISSVQLKDGRTVCRACITHAKTTGEDLRSLVDSL